MKACPNCNDSSIVHTSQNGRANGTEMYRCTACGESFKEPKEREPEGHRNSVKGLAKKLKDMSPEDL